MGGQPAERVAPLSPSSAVPPPAPTLGIPSNANITMFMIITIELRDGNMIMELQCLLSINRGEREESMILSISVVEFTLAALVSRVGPMVNVQ